MWDIVREAAEAAKVALGVGVGFIAGAERYLPVEVPHASLSINYMQTKDKSEYRLQIRYCKF